MVTLVHIDQMGTGRVEVEGAQRSVPAAERSSAGCSVMSRLIMQSADGASQPASQPLQIDVYPVAELWPFPQAQPDTFRAFLKKLNIYLLLSPFPPLLCTPPQIIDLLPGDYTHCHRGDQ